ncbi:MAG: hypothetical protein V4582_21935 [Pseudomonadota bacterium]
MGKSNSCATDLTGKSEASGASGATPAAPKAQTAKNKAEALMMRALRVVPSSLDQRLPVMILFIGLMQSVKIYRFDTNARLDLICF